MQNRVSTPARVGQIAVLTVAFSALMAAALRFYLNTRIDALSDGRVTAQTVDDIKMVADVGLLVMSSLAVVAALTLSWWLARVHTTADFRPGPGGIAALIGGVAGVALIAIFFFLDQETVAGTLAANSLIVLGLGLIIASCIATVRTIGRIDLRKPA